MPYPNSFIRHTLLWNLPGGENAACTVAWNSDPGGVVPPLATGLLDIFADKATALWAGIDQGYGEDISFVGSRVSSINTTGGTAATYELAISPDPGTTALPSLPSEVSVVCSLRTGTGTRSGRGRIYLPAPHRDTCSTGGRFLAAAQDEFADAVATYLESFTFSGTDFFSVVASEVQTDLYPVTSLRVGDVFDAQRRRRDRLVEVNEIRSVS